jgi:hypothetical protein
MGRHVIIALKSRLSRSVHTHRDKFTLRKERGWVWLQRLCFWVLRKIGAYHLETIETVTYGPFDRNEKLSQRLFDIVEETLGWDTFDDTQWMVVMGRDEFRQLDQDKELLHVFGFVIGMEMRRPIRNRFGEYKVGTFHGIDVVVLPWVEGMTLVPKTSLAYSKTIHHVADCTAAITDWNP